MSGIFTLSDRDRILDLTWFAFFLSFVVWFNFVSTAIQAEFDLKPTQIRIIQLN